MSKTKTLGRDDILAIDDLPTRTVNVPEWGGTITLRSLTAAERDAWEIGLYNEKSGGKPMNISASVVALCAIKPDGTRLFTDADIEVLARKSGRVLKRLWNAASDLNGLGVNDAEELEKN